MATVPNCDAWVELFDSYKDLPELWKVKSDVFKDRNKKRVAWATLLNVYKKIDKDANIDSLKKRLTNIKTCFRRELKKVEKSQRSGAGLDDEYVPTLWYYDKLEFLKDQETQIPGLSTMDMALVDDEEVEESFTEESIRTPTSSQKRKKSIGQQMEERNDLLKDALGQLKKTKDEASIYADSWAATYRKLTPIQQIYAKRAIEEVLVLGQLEMLTLNTIKNPPTSSHSSSTSTSSQSLHNYSPLPSRTTTPIYQQPLSSPQFENNIFIPSQGSYTNLRDLISDNNFS